MTETANQLDHRFCVFQTCNETLALTAAHVRSVSPQPEIMALPFTDKAMIGISHLQKEFLPVYDLSRLMPSVVSAKGTKESRRLLIVSVDEGDFGLLVDQVYGLESLEISYTASPVDTADQEGSWSNIVCGAATYRDQFVSVVDTLALTSWLLERQQIQWDQFEDKFGLASTAMASK